MSDYVWFRFISPNFNPNPIPDPNPNPNRIEIRRAEIRRNERSP